MQMNFITNYLGVKKILLFEEGITIVTKSEVWINFNQRLEAEKDDFFTIRNNKLFRKNNNNYSFYSNSKFSILEKGCSGIHFENETTYLTIKHDVESLTTYFKLVSGNENSTFDVNGLNSVIDFSKNRIVILDGWEKKNVSVIDNYGYEIWKHEIPDKFKIRGSCFTYQNTLILFVNNKKMDNGHVIGIDLTTGEELWKTQVAVPYQPYVQHPETGWLYIFSGYYYRAINPNTGKIEFERKFDNIGADKNSIYDNKLWFCSNYYTAEKKFGAINLQTNEIEFVQNIELKEGEHLGAPIYHEGKLYILDTEGVLRIFEQPQA